MSRKARKSGWDELCASVQADDGLPTRDSGYWAKEKLWFWNRYVEITTTAMAEHPHWPDGVVYVDLFAGPGVCRDRNSGKRFPGSPLIAANAPKPFRKILLCEKDHAIADACLRRLAARLTEDRFNVFKGDCNGVISAVCQQIPRGSLTLGFLDPTGLHLSFDTVRQLSNSGAVDLLILFPDSTDILRNADHVYFDQPESNLDRVLGPGSNWRERKRELASTEPRRLRELYSSLYKQQLERLCGYRHFGEEVIKGPHGPLYRLIYATKHERGIDFWNKSVKKELGGRQRLF
jgi:three-Cys-motif partner protein